MSMYVRYSRRLQKAADNVSGASLERLSYASVLAGEIEEDENASRTELVTTGIEAGLSLAIRRDLVHGHSVNLTHDREVVRVWAVTCNDALGESTFYFVGILSKVLDRLRANADR